MAIGTARMASLCLPNSELHVGVNFETSKDLDRALSNPEMPAVLLYPGKQSIDVMKEPPGHAVTLVVVDGTWWQAKKLIRSNPRIAALPRYAFVPPRPSEYRIRKEPDEEYVSTIEALVHVLGVLENDRESFEALLVPFRAMIDAQIACEKELRDSRHRKNRPTKRPYRARVPKILAERIADFVCVVGEANAWPYKDKDHNTEYPDELVHWVAHRLSTGETFECLARPRNPLAPRTSSNVDISAADLESAEPLGEMFAAWNAFVKPSDVICAWGHYAPALFRKSGGEIPDARLDLRQIARDHLKRKVGTLELFCQSVNRVPTSSLTRGRAGKRLAQTVGILRMLVEIAQEDAERMREL